MKEITDEYMQEQISRTKEYCIMILKAGPNRNMAGSEQIVWEHGRRNFSLRSGGVLSIVCPIADSSGISGIKIFNAGMERVQSIMDEDPGVKAGIFVYEIHTCQSFPGDSCHKEKPVYGRPLIFLWFFLFFYGGILLIGQTFAPFKLPIAHEYRFLISGGSSFSGIGSNPSDV